MNSCYDFNAPQFLSLSNDDAADHFFDALESSAKASCENSIDSVSAEITMNADNATVPECNVTDHENKDPNVGPGINQITIKKTPNTKHKKEKPDDLCRALENLTLGSAKKSTQPTPRKFEGILIQPEESRKSHRMKTRLDVLKTPVLELRNRSISRPAPNDSPLSTSPASSINTDSPQEPSSTVISNVRTSVASVISQCSQRLSTTIAFKRPTTTDMGACHKYIALAEKVRKFHFDTPDRYRRNPRIKQQQFFQPQHYQAESPELMAVKRSRPTNYLTQAEREQKEYEEMIKNQFKAQPVNKKILEQVCLGVRTVIEKKNSTVQQPFKLHVAIPKTKCASPVFKFKAQPCPSKILQKPIGVPPKKFIPLTSPKTPNIKLATKPRMVTPVLSAASSRDTLNNDQRRKEVIPFSFEERDKNLLRKKEENIKKILDEEKKLFSCFKANPLPAYLGSAGVVSKPSIFDRINTPARSCSTTEAPCAPQFKAKPANVLKRAPFFPKHDRNEVIEKYSPKFRTDERIEKRKEFDEKIREAELNREKALREKEIQDREEAEKEAKEFRKLTEFKAKPVPKFKAFAVQSSNKPLTEPKSPAFTSGKKGTALSR